MYYLQGTYSLPRECHQYDMKSHALHIRYVGHDFSEHVRERLNNTVVSVYKDNIAKQLVNFAFRS